MDSTVYAAIITAVATVAAAIIGVIGVIIARHRRKHGGSGTSDSRMGALGETIITIIPSSNPRIMRIQKETLPIVLAMAEPKRFSDAMRGKLLLKGLEKGWPAIVADLEYLVEHVPEDETRYRGFQALLDCAKQAVEKRKS